MGAAQRAAYRPAGSPVWRPTSSPSYEGGASFPRTAIRVPTGGQLTRPVTGLASGGVVSDFTFGAWLRRDSQPQQYTSWFVLDSTADPGGADSYFWFGHDSLAGGGARGFSIYGNAGSHATDLLPAFGVWFHAAVTKTGSTVRAYQNGALVNWDTGGTAVNIAQATYNQIDVCKLMKEGAGDDFNGAVRALFFKSSAMSQAEIQAAMLKSSPIASGVASYPLAVHTNLTDALGGAALTSTGVALSTTTGPAGIVSA